jgi:hypothetical protein
LLIDHRLNLIFKNCVGDNNSYTMEMFSFLVMLYVLVCACALLI